MNNTLTAMNELIEYLNSLPHRQDTLGIRKLIKIKATELLHKEKTDLAKSFLAGMNRVIGDRPNQPNFDDYYNKTYNQ